MTAGERILNWLKAKAKRREWIDIPGHLDYEIALRKGPSDPPPRYEFVAHGMTRNMGAGYLCANRIPSRS